MRTQKRRTGLYVCGSHGQVAANCGLPGQPGTDAATCARYHEPSREMGDGRAREKERASTFFRSQAPRNVRRLCATQLGRSLSGSISPSSQSMRTLKGGRGVGWIRHIPWEPSPATPARLARRGCPVPLCCAPSWRLKCPHYSRRINFTHLRNAFVGETLNQRKQRGGCSCVREP